MHNGGSKPVPFAGETLEHVELKATLFEYPRANVETSANKLAEWTHTHREKIGEQAAEVHAFSVVPNLVLAGSCFARLFQTFNGVANVNGLEVLRLP